MSEMSVLEERISNCTVSWEMFRRLAQGPDYLDVRETGSSES